MIVNYHSPRIFELHGCIIVSKAEGGLNRATGSSSSILRWVVATIHKGNSLDNIPAKAILLQHLGDIGEENYILDQS